MCPLRFGTAEQNSKFVCAMCIQSKQVCQKEGQDALILQKGAVAQGGPENLLVCSELLHSLLLVLRRDVPGHGSDGSALAAHLWPRIS